MKFTVVVFPGTTGHKEVGYVLGGLLGQDVKYLDHRQPLGTPDCVILSGGASFGDYLRPGALAAHTPILEEIKAFAESGGMVLGIGNGFQILLEAGLLPGAMTQNSNLRFISKEQTIKVETTNSAVTSLYQENQLLALPIACGFGNYYLPPEELEALENQGQIIFRYGPGTNPNGSLGDLAGVSNKEGNVLGVIFRPERRCEEVLGGTAGLPFFQALIASCERRKAQC